MSKVAVPADAPPDLIDLRFLPAWVKEDAAARYSDFEGEEMPLETRAPRERIRREERRRDKHRNKRDRRDRPEPQRDHKQAQPSPRRPQPTLPIAPPQLDIRFLPRAAAFENVAAQIKSGAVAYSLYALARLFLQKPERYDVRVTAKENEKSFYRLGQSSVIGGDRGTLENSAFRTLKNEFYETEVTLSEPVKGNFTSVARERTTGALLGPTNHHAYQPQLRRLYEQRFSRRMGFADFQRQIQIVGDPTLVEQWKEEARKQTKFTTRQEDPAQTFASEADAERHFRGKYLPGLVTETREAEIDGRTSRILRDHRFARTIENAWSIEERSPSKMMQELAARFRSAGLHIFRHRKGMLFVSPIRPKPIDESAVSDSVRTILEAVKASPRMNRKELAEKLIVASSEDAKLKLAANLHWLIREGHLLEFNDGSLDLPRTKVPAAAESSKAIPPPGDAGQAINQETLTAATVVLSPETATENPLPG